MHSRAPWRRSCWRSREACRLRQKQKSFWLEVWRKLQRAKCTGVLVVFSYLKLLGRRVCSGESGKATHAELLLWRHKQVQAVGCRVLCAIASTLETHSTARPEKSLCGSRSAKRRPVSAEPHGPAAHSGTANPFTGEGLHLPSEVQSTKAKNSDPSLAPLHMTRGQNV